MNLKKRLTKLCFIFLLIYTVTSAAAQNGNFYESKDLKILITIVQDSPCASVWYASGRKELLDITSKLLTEINAYLELGLWITEKSYFMGKPVTIYGFEKNVRELMEILNKN